VNFIYSLGFKVYSDELSKIAIESNNCRIINTISPNSYGISTKDSLFRASLKNSDYLVLDGVYFSLASIFLKGKNIKKNQGPDVYSHFMHRMNEKSGKVFFLGSSEEILKKMAIKALSDYPNIQIASNSPPYKHEFSVEDNRKMIDTINDFVPEVLFVGMTCPKQEKWAFQNKELIKANLICCVGAVFDWYAGNEKPIAPIWWKLRLAWLKRTIDRPEILKRYPNIGIFFWHLFLALIGFKKYRYGNF
jgi:N-acetylglucosaminyldiphosphoundecaprenol N-acetyl-beta-D-mannosaminyltransferase